MKKSLTALILAACLLCGAAAAETISFTGTVEASESVRVYAPLGGTVDAVPVRAGETVTADTVIARIRTTKVYASQDGTVTAVYGMPGDEAEHVAATYGAVMYLEGETLFTVSATTARAYDDKANYIVHSGEKVYLISRNHTLDNGQGIITEVGDSSYTVRVTEGSFYVGDSVDVFRNEDTAASSRVGRGSIARVAPEAVTGTGSIVSFAVQAGDRVKRGQLLFETAEGPFEGLEMTGTEIRAGTDGTVSTLNVEEGAALNAGSTVAVIWPGNAMRVAMEVPEADLKELAVGQKVKVELDWNQDDGVSYEGTVEMISALGTAGEESTTYTAYVTFEPDENTRYGMTAVVTTPETKEPEEETEAEEGTEPEETETEAQSEEGRPGGRSGERPSGREWPADGERPSNWEWPVDGEWPGDGELPSGWSMPGNGEWPSGAGTAEADAPAETGEEAEAPAAE